MVVNEANKGNRSVRPKLMPNDNRDSKAVTKAEKKHRLKQRFEVIKKLGQGTYGKVQLAINKETGQEVAIKTIKKSKVESDQDLIRIRREIQIMSSIQHPHIVHIFEVFENKDKIVLVMQYASGGEVYDYVSYRKVLSDTEARRLFRQIATAIYYCHKNKICHRDLKLENILLDEKGNAKIADFGLSNVFDDRHFLQTFCGSPLYASPEIVKGSPYYGPEVDCWSLGVLLYTLVYGAMPFDGSNFKRLVKQISESNYFEPKEKSDASALIKRLLTPNPTKRATIIDICTDWWVNCGYEHSLLQVAEDMANLTPVRLDILLALAPVSPSAEQLGKNPFDISENKNKETNDKPQESIDNLLESADDISSSSVSILDNMKKREASASFDQSLTQFPTPTQTPRKKKTKKSPSNDSSSSKVSEDKPIETNQQINKLISDQTSNTEMTSDMDQQKDENLVPINEQLCDTETQAVDEKDVITPSDRSTEQIESQNTQNDSLVDNQIVVTQDEIDLIASKPQQSFDIINDTNQSNRDLQSIETETKAKETAQLSDSGNNKEVEVNLVSNQSNLNETLEVKESKINLIIDKESEKLSAVQESDEIKVENDDKKKIKVSRSGSGKRPGRLSIPKLWDKTPELGETSPTKSLDNKLTNQSNESKKPMESKPDKKVPFIPVGFRVSDAKRAFERRCSVPANSLLQTNSFNKRRESKPNTELKEVRERAPKLSTRSFSLNEMLESPKKVQELNVAQIKKKETIDETVEVVKQSKVEDEITAISQQSSAQNETNENTSTDTKTDNIVDKKLLAKDILKKTIAKAKLIEKRQNSNESGSNSPVTTPLASIENSDVCITQEPSFFRTPRPYVKEELQKPTIETPIEIKVKPNFNQKFDQNQIVSKQSDSKIRKYPTDRVMGSDVTQEDINEKIDSPQPTKSAPIARSYKKVTFTKDGATITETGKIYSAEGVDGSYTRVEKKSKVTHFPTIEDEIQSHSNNSNVSLQRSDSQSSSGSVDIFDDIFDDHWCGDSIFPNMKSILHGVIGSKKGGKTRRRSRAESCERKNSDWFTNNYSSKKTNSNLTDQESDNDDYENSFSKSVWPTIRPMGSIFDRSSVFSRHFSKEFDKDFGGIDDSTHPFHEFNRSLSKDRSSISSRIHPTSFKVVFGTQPSVKSGVTNRDPFETDDALKSSNKFETGVKSKIGDRSKTWSREHDSMFSEKEPNNFPKHDSFDSSRKRVEQWLQSDNNEENEENDRKAPFSMYATVGPRGVRRYLRTVSNRPNEKQSSENSSTNSGVYRNTSDTIGSQQKTPIYPNTCSTVPKESVVEMRFSFNPTNLDNNKPVMNSSTTLSDLNTTSISNCQTSLASEPSECSDEYQSSIVLPESSSLLDQLRTHGYRNIVSQRLSGSSLFSDLDSSQAENDTNYKRGKSVLNSSSSVLNENTGACECMDRTNPMATITTAASLDATHTNANNNELKASQSMNTATQVEFADSQLHFNTEIIKKSFKQTMNQQSSEPTSRPITYKERINTYRDSPECKTPLNRNEENNNDMNSKETVQERIHRKSFYSRFNDDRPTLTTRQRRRSFIDTEDIGSLLETKHSSRRSSNLSSNSFRNSLSLDANSFIAPKPPSISSDWFNRMDSRASQLMDELMENDRVSLFRQQLRNRELPEESFEPRRRSSSSTRSSFSTPRSHKSDFDSYLNTYSKAFSNNEESNLTKFNNLLEDITSPTEVLRRAIDILSQKD